MAPMKMRGCQARRGPLARPTGPVARGFTLLEVLLAAAVLSSIMLLAALVLAQGRSWNDENQGHFRAMRLVRVTELLTRQWADRRSAVSVDASGVNVRAEPDRLSFITATPVLHRGWPLVLATYRIEKRARESSARLVYEESRVSRFGAQREAGASRLESPATGDEEPLRTLLLKDVKELRFERYGPRLSPDERVERPGLGGGEGADDDEARKPGWWRYDEPFKGPIPAVRLAGSVEDKEFTCVFVVERSR